MGIGGTSSTGHTSNPTTVFSPVAFGGGNIVAGDVGTGGVGMSGGSEAGGGSFDFKLDMPMPIPAMQLQNLQQMDYNYGSYEDMPYYPMQMQNLGFSLKKITKPIGHAATTVGHGVVKAAPTVERIAKDGAPYVPLAVAIIAL